MNPMYSSQKVSPPPMSRVALFIIMERDSYTIMAMSGIVVHSFSIIGSDSEQPKYVFSIGYRESEDISIVRDQGLIITGYCINIRAYTSKMRSFQPSGLFHDTHRNLPFSLQPPFPEKPAALLPVYYGVGDAQDE